MVFPRPISSAMIQLVIVDQDKHQGKSHGKFSPILVIDKSPSRTLIQKLEVCERQA